MEEDRSRPQRVIQIVPDADHRPNPLLTTNFQNNLEPRNYDVKVEKLDLALQNLILPVTFLGLAILAGFLLLFALLLHWRRFMVTWRSCRNSSDPCQTKNMEEESPTDPTKSFKVELVDDCKKQIVEPRLLTNEDRVKFAIEPERFVNVVKTQSYGGSPKVFDKDENITGEDRNKFVFPGRDVPSCSKTNENPSENYPKMLPSQWMPYKKTSKAFPTNIPRPFPLLEMVKKDLGSELNEGRGKFNSTRSPSLEKDDRSPFVSSAKSDKSEVFVFDNIENNNKPMKKSFSINETNDNENTNLRRYCSVNTKLNLYTAGEAEIQQEKLQNSPRYLECSSGKEKSAGSRFNFSPKLLSENQQYSPKFFPESPHSPKLSPKILDNEANTPNLDNRKEKPCSPRVLSGNRTRSPRVCSSNKENFFTFDCIDTNASEFGYDVLDCTNPANRRSSYIHKYGGRKSIERERCPPPEKLDLKKYRRHHSCENSAIEHLDPIEILGTDVLRHEISANNNEIKIDTPDSNVDEIVFTNLSALDHRRRRLKSISLDSDNAKIIEQNLGIPIAQHLTDQREETYDSIQELQSYKQDSISPETPKKYLCSSADVTTFTDMPRFSPKELEITITLDQCEEKKRQMKNPRNLTIDLSKRDVEVERELLEFEKLYSDCEKKKVKTPTLKIKATSLDSSESANLSLPKNQTLDVPLNSISVPNTPKRNKKRLITKKVHSHDRRQLFKNKPNFNDSGVYLRDHHANLMIYQPSTSRQSCFMGSFDENAPTINISFDAPEDKFLAQLIPNLSLSSTNLKTLPEGVPSIDFDVTHDERTSKKLLKRGSNPTLVHDASKYSTVSLQSSNNSLSSTSNSCYNIMAMRNSASNFSLDTDNRQKKNLFERRNSNNALMVNAEIPSTSKSIPTVQHAKSGLLQRRGSNNSLSLNLQNSNCNLNRFASNSSLSINKDKRKGLLERRSSNTSLSLNINNSHPQLTTNRGMSVSNYNINGSSCNLQRYNSAASINHDSKKSILERRSSNTSLTLNLQNQDAAPRDVYIDEKLIDKNLKGIPQHRKSLSTENLLPKSYKVVQSNKSECQSYGSHENLWSQSYIDEGSSQKLTYVGGDHENEIIYAFGDNENKGFVRNITTKPLSPQSTSEDFKLYLANIQHLQNASSVLTRQQLKDLNEIFQNGYSNEKCENSSDIHTCSGEVHSDAPCSEYQKSLMRHMHQEFWDLPTNFQEKPLVFGSHLKNRYKSILPNDHSRFILKCDGNGEGYINANYVKGHEYAKNSYIATQGPLQNTIYDFWLMVYQNIKEDYQTTGKTSVQKIVMLTNLIENNKQKCESYFPVEIDEEVKYSSPEPAEGCSSFFSETDSDKDSFTIKNEGVITKTGYTIRKLQITHTTHTKNIPKMQSFYANHYWFHNWADHKCPKDVSALLNLSLDILSSDTHDFNAQMNEVTQEMCACTLTGSVDEQPITRFVFPPADVVCSPTQSDVCDLTAVKSDRSLKMAGDGDSLPVIVHCSAGIGRTGCLIAILNGIKQLNLDNKVDILGIVCNMRLNRGGMVQNSEQYELIHKVLCLYEQTCMGIVID